MGIYFRYTAAFLTLCLLSLDATATVRVNAKSKAKDIISKPLESGFSLPNGAEAYYGRDKMFEIDNRLNASAGSSIGPTVRPVPSSTVGNVSFPYGPNAAYPNGSGVPNPVLKVREKVKFPKTSILKTLKKGLKLNPGSLLLQASVAAAVGGAGWIIEQGQIKKRDTEPVPATDGSWWCHSSAPTNCTVTGSDGNKRRAGPLDYAQYVADVNASIGASNPRLTGSVTPDTTQVSWCVDRNSTSCFWSGKVYRFGTCSAPNVVNNQGVCEKLLGYSPITENDLDMLDPWVNSQSADWLRGLIQDVCKGSLSPEGCYADMKEGGGFDLSGPTTLQGPSTTKTTTTQNPDGSTSTRTDTSSTNYSVTYNNNNNTFDVDTKITNTTTVDGQVTETSEQTDDTPAVDLPPEEETPEETYTFDDAEFPTVEPFYEVKYPDGLQGVWQSISAQIDQSAFIEFLKGFVPSFSGSCPAFGLSFNISSWANYGAMQFSSVCYALDFVKIIILVTAIFTFRKVVFGG